MGSIITVPTGGKSSINFNRDIALYTADLEACVAVAGKHGDTGALMHLTQITPLDEAFSWFYEQIPTEGGLVYLVGGMKGKAEHFVSALRKRLANLRYAPPKEKVLTDFYIDLIFRRDHADLDYSRLIKGPEGFQFIPSGSETL